MKMVFSGPSNFLRLGVSKVVTVKFNMVFKTTGGGGPDSPEGNTRREGMSPKFFCGQSPEALSPAFH